MMIFSGIFDLPWWAYLLIALVLTHTTIAAVTIFLHRHQTHRTLDLHPTVSHVFPFWLWMTTGMVTKEWVAVDRKHHANVETSEDPHSAQIHGIGRLLLAGVFLYMCESRDRDTIEKYGHGTPNANIVPWGILIGGEEFHNNHYAYPLSAKLSSAWYDFDVGWIYMRLLETLGLARVRRIAPVPQFSPDKTVCDADTVKAIITHRYYVLAQYTRSVRGACRYEVSRLKQHGAARSGEGIDVLFARNLRRWLRLHTWDRRAGRPIILEPLVYKDRLLHTVYSMRQELSDLWGRSSASTDQLLKQLCDWRERAESSGIAALREFARRLPHLV